MTIQELNGLGAGALGELLQRCNGSGAWLDGMLRVFPVKDAGELMAAASAVWHACEERDWLEAFTHHPRIGDLGSLRERFASTRQWAAGEQSGVGAASDAVLEALSAGNRAYEARFGYIFIVCATGKSAEEMLALLEARLGNDPEKEIHIAMGEQEKITRVRLEKLLS